MVRIFVTVRVFRRLVLETLRMKKTPLKILHAFSAAILLLSAGTAIAQGVPPQSAPAGRSPVCSRLEGQLTAIDRGNTDPGRADQIKRYEDASNKQQFELDRLIAQSRRIGCEGSGFFALFSGQPAQCGQVNTQIQQMRANLDRILGDLERLQGGTADREGQRRAVLVALNQNDCGAQYRSASVQQPRGFFESLFGPGSIVSPSEPYQSSTFRTVCVRTCDGFYFPISFATNPSKFSEDERVCQRMCPATEVALYSHRNPGEDMSQAVSVGGRPYTELSAAFRYRQEVNSACSCRRAGQSWSDALRQLDDNTLERGDIVVTDERARQLSQPPQAKKADPKATPAVTAPAAAVSAPAEEKSAETSGEKRKVRTVGPTFYPVR
jgi:hypothetical protein